MSKDMFEKILKNKNNRIICIILIIGVVLMLISSGGSKKDKISDKTTVYDEEARLEEILSDIDGADSATVRQAISEAVTAVTDVAAHRVAIYKRSQK